MPRFRRFSPPVRHNKEIIDSVLLVVAAGVTSSVAIATAVNDYIGTAGTHPISAKIKAFWLEVSYTKGENTVGRIDWLLMKKPAGVSTAGVIPGSTGGNVARKYILLERKGLASLDGLLEQGGSPARFAGWIMVPKRFQNMAEGDSWEIRVGASVVHNFCLKALYKWVA